MTQLRFSSRRCSHAAQASRLGLLGLLVSSSLLAGCDRKTEPAPQLEKPALPEAKSPPASTPPSSASPEVSPQSTEGEVVWEVPESWKEMPARMMRKATYQAEGKAGPAEIGVFYFGQGQGGSVEANIDRWIGQFSGVADGATQRSEEEINGMKRYNVLIEKGTFSGGMPGMPGASTAEQKDWALHASIVKTPQGDYYFKMIGPAATVAEQKQNFQVLLSSIAWKK